MGRRKPPGIGAPAFNYGNRAVIRLENVTKQFPGGSNAVRDLTLEITDGQTCVLIGPSGCGKTTTLRMINRLIDPDRGRILVDGVDTRSVDPAALRLKMGYVIDEAVIVGDRICLLKMQAQVAQYDTPERILTQPASEYVAEFLGRERLVRRMSVVQIDATTLDRPQGGPSPQEPRVALSSTLAQAFAAALSRPTEPAGVCE